MYLTAKIYLGNYSGEDLKKKGKQVRKLLPEMFESGNLNSVEVGFEAGYWRKANAIHAWFVETCQKGVDECQISDVSRKQLQKLKELCGDELKARDEDEASEGKLEPKSGFFFETYEKDEWYYGALEETIKIVDKCLELPEEWSFEYRSSW